MATLSFSESFAIDFFLPEDVQTSTPLLFSQTACPSLLCTQPFLVKQMWNFDDDEKGQLLRIYLHNDYEATLLMKRKLLLTKQI